MASTTKLIVIIGITGIQGGSVARLYQTLPSWRIRGITRNPNKESCKPLRDAGIELVVGDLDDQASLERAFEGASAIFSVTDFWQFLNMPTTFEKAVVASKQPNQIAYDLEVQQGNNIIHAAAKCSTLERLVVSTLSDSPKWSKGEIKWNLHFDGKAKYTEYLKQEFSDLAKKTSYLQVGYYLSNRNVLSMKTPQKQEDGTYVYHTLGYPDKVHPLVHPPNDTGYFVKALIEHPEANKTMLGYCANINFDEFVANFSKVKGVKTKAGAIPYEGYVAGGIPEFIAQEISDAGKYCSVWGWDGGDPEVQSPAELGVEMKKLTKIEEWIKNEDWSDVGL